MSDDRDLMDADLLDRMDRNPEHRWLLYVLKGLKALERRALRIEDYKADIQAVQASTQISNQTLQSHGQQILDLRNDLKPLAEIPKELSEQQEIIKELKSDIARLKLLMRWLCFFAVGLISAGVLAYIVWGPTI